MKRHAARLPVAMLSALLSAGCASSQRPGSLPAGESCDEGGRSTPACDYALAIALGLQARDHPSTARGGLSQMVLLLRRAALAEPDLDHAGPDRVLALVLLRAPGWPLGPGDPEEALVVAGRAAARFRDYAPNQLALSEALAANGEPVAARAAANRALALAESAAAAGVPEASEWVREARDRAMRE